MHPGSSEIINACCLTLQSHLSFYCLSLCLYLACLKKSAGKASVLWKLFIFKIAGVHSSLERRVKTIDLRSSDHMTFDENLF